MEYLGTINKKIYTGEYDIREIGKNITINVEGNNVQLNINNIMENSQMATKMLALSEVEYISKHSNIKACIYPTGRWSWHKLDTSDDRLKSCYMLLSMFTNCTYIFTIAFDEIQPALYEAELISIFRKVIAK